MGTLQTTERRDTSIGGGARERLLAGLPITERRLQLAGITTSVLEGGDGPPVVLLHGPGEFAAKWMRVIPDLTATHRVVAPDLPGHGASGTADGPIDVERVVAWLRELVDRTCASPPTLVGQIFAGAMAARFAARHPERVGRLVLVDTLGLAPFQPAPEFGAALMAFSEQPDEHTFEQLWRRCAFDLDRLRGRLGDRWATYERYTLETVRAPHLRPTLGALMERFAFPAIPPDELARITVPTSLIWGRHDLATPLDVARAASERYGWPLQVIEGAADDPPFEQPEAFVRALRATIDGSDGA